jgi:GGDEF domain-containing protein
VAIGVFLVAVQVLRVLLAESGATETGVLLRALCAHRGRSLELFLVSNRGSLSQALRHFNPDVAFLALALLRPEPLHAISLLHESAPHIPLILFALPAESASAAECLQSGAKDYVLEGYMDVPTLDHVLHAATKPRAIAVSPGISRSRVDSLTNLMNRSGLLVQAQHSLRGSPLSDSCLIFSIHVERRQDLLAASGKVFVDHTLQQIAQRLVGCVRRSDLVAHVSKGVFVIVVANANPSSLSALQRRLEACLVHFSQREFRPMPWHFSLLNSSWRNSSAVSFGEILSAHLSPKHSLDLPDPDSSAAVLALPGGRSET